MAHPRLHEGSTGELSYPPNMLAKLGQTREVVVEDLTETHAASWGVVSGGWCPVILQPLKTFGGRVPIPADTTLDEILMSGHKPPGHGFFFK